MSDLCTRCGRRPIMNRRYGLCSPCDAKGRKDGEVERRVFLALGDLAWQADALCRDIPRDLFFDRNTAHRAKKVCARCPVRDRCLDMALGVTRSADLVGIFGGMTVGERNAERRRRAAVAVAS